MVKIRYLDWQLVIHRHLVMQFGLSPQIKFNNFVNFENSILSRLKYRQNECQSKLMVF